MANISFTKTFSDGSTLPGSDLNTLQSDVSSYINARNGGSATWDTVQATHATNVPAIFNNSTGTQDILRCQDNGTNVLVVADGGIISMASQSAVRAYLGVANVATSAGVYHDVVFNTEVYDTKSEYNTTTGSFTATVTGKYLITASVRGALAQNGDNQGLSIITNGLASGATFFERAADVPSVGAGGCIMLSDVIPLTAGQTAKISYVNGSRNDEIYASTTYSWLAIHKIA